MRSILLVAVVCALSVQKSRAEDTTFAAVEEIYATTVEHIVREHKRADRSLAIMFADPGLRDDAPEDKPLWQTLSKRLKAKGLDADKHLVPREEVVFQEENLRFTQKSTDRIVWVHQISGLKWRGGNRVVIAHGVCRDKVDFRPEPALVFVYRQGKWQLEGETDKGQGPRGQQTDQSEKRPLLVTDLEAIHLAAFESFVSGGDVPVDRVYCIALGSEQDGSLLQLPGRFGQQLKARLGARMRAGFVPAEQVAWDDEQTRYYHKPTGKDAWVYRVGAVEWRGADRLYAPVSISHGALAGGGETLVFVKVGDTWHIAYRIDCWDS